MNPLRIVALLLAISSQSYAQHDSPAAGNNDQPVTAKDILPAPLMSAIPLDGFPAATGSSRCILTTLAGGTYEVGDDQPVFKKLTDVAEQLNTATVMGDVIFELNATYDGTAGETFPVVFNQFASAGGSWTVTIRVKNGVSTRNTTGNTGNPLIIMDGVDNLTLDGRAGGTGTSISWNFYNFHDNGTIVHFINDAQWNTISYCDLVSLHKTLGVVSFGSTTGTEGNDHNTIAYCNIHDNGTDSPGFGIYSAGNTGSNILYNSANTVSNCNIWNIFNDGGICGSVYLETGCTSWIITGNSFYQTVDRNPAGAMTAFEMVIIYSGDGHTVTNNYIGGSAPLCGGSPWTISGTSTSRLFYGIDISDQDESNYSNISGNTITNIHFEYKNASSSQLGLIVFSGFCITDGIHYITNNTVGSSTGTGSIYIKTGPSWSNYVTGIFYQYGQGGSIDNNTFGSFLVDAYPATISGYTSYFDMHLIRVNNVSQIVPLSISGNLCGSLNTPNSIQCNAISGSTGGIRLSGITSSMSQTQNGLTVNNNTVSNITINSTTATSALKGITQGSYSTGADISGNLVRDLNNNAPNTTTMLTAGSVLGMQLLLYTPGTVRNNQVYNITASNSTIATTSAGMFLQTGPAVGNVIFEGNSIHNLNNITSSASGHIIGINVNSGTYNVINNFVSLGIKPDGSPVTNGCQITGILDAAGNNNYFNNSIYIGGTVSSGATGNTTCFNSTSTTTLRNIINNIFFNARSGGTTGKHYALRLAGTGVNHFGLNSNYNLLLANGAVGSTLGYYNGNITTLDAWKSTTGQDMSSGVGNPNFLNPAGSTTTVNLHIQSPTPVEGGGIVLSDVSSDYDGNARSELTPADIGADAGNFTSSGDIFGPAIAYTTLPNSNTANRILTNFAVINDNISVAGGSNSPRFYFKRATDANAFVGNTAADNGWKYVVATNTTSPYSFVVDYSLLYGGNVVSGDVIQYFVAAQDMSGNLNSYPMLALATATPPISNINTAPAVLNQYVATDVMLSGVITVPGTYPTLTGAGGLFDVINNSLVSGNLTVNITGNLTEPGTFALNQFSSFPENSAFSMNIQPDAAVEKVITGAVANGLIRFNGADAITVDGNYNGTGRYLKFINTNTSNATFIIQNDALNLSLSNLVIEGANSSTTSGVITIGGTNQLFGNDNLTISGNIIRNLVSGVAPNTLIYSNGTVSRNNDNITITDNELFNYKNYGISVTALANGNNWTITGNSIYCNLSPAPTTGQTAINFIPGAQSSGHTISNNFIGGTAARCGGTPWVNAANASFYGINSSIGDEFLNTYENNIVSNISLTNSGTTHFYGIYFAGSSSWINFIGNLVGNAEGPHSINIAGAGYFYGFGLTCSRIKQNNILNNTVAGINMTSPGWYMFNGMIVNGLVNLTHNTIGNTNSSNSIVVNLNVSAYQLYPSIIPTQVVSGITGMIEGYAGHNTIAGILLNGIMAGSFTGINMTQNYPRVVDGNLIYNCGPGSASVDNGDIVGITSSITGSNATFINNVISLGHGITNNHVYKGIDDKGTAGTLKICNNSINLGGICSGTSHSYGFIKRSTSSFQLMNNIFANFRSNGTSGTGKHYGAGLTESFVPVLSDYNDFYNLNAPLFVKDITDYVALADWKATCDNDMHSVSADPLFYSDENLRVCSPALENTGTAIDEVTEDFTEASRNNPPDIGAFEFTLPVASITTGSPDDFCNGELLTAHSTINPATYQWSTGETGQSVFLNIADDDEGLYTVYVYDENGCRSAMPAEYTYMPEELVSSYTLLGFEVAQLGEDNNLLNGAMGLTGAGMTAQVKKNTMVNGEGSFVKASVIVQHPTAIVARKIYEPVTVELPEMHYNTVSGTFSNVTIGNNVTTTINDNSINLTVGQNSNVTLTGNTFGNIQAGKGSTVTFSGDSFDISSLKALPGTSTSPVTFNFTQDAEVRVKTRVDLDNYGIMNPANYKLTFFIGEQYENTGLLQLKAPGLVFNGSAYLPAGQVHVITDGIKNAPALINGKFIANKILGTGKNVTWNWYDCGSATTPQYLTPLALEETRCYSDDMVSVYPVPNNGLFRARIQTIGNETFTMKLYNAVGIMVKEKAGVTINDSGEVEIDVRPLTKGIYTIVFENINRRINSKISVY